MKNELIKEIHDISEYVKTHIPNDIDQMMDGLENMRVHLARSGELFAQATTLYKLTRMQVRDKLIEDKPHLLKSVSVLKDMVDDLCAEEFEVMNSAERLNRAITHGGEWLRSNISAEKSLMPSRSYENKPPWGGAAPIDRTPFPTDF